VFALFFYGAGRWDGRFWEVFVSVESVFCFAQVAVSKFQKSPAQSSFNSFLALPNSPPPPPGASLLARLFISLNRIAGR